MQSTRDNGTLSSKRDIRVITYLPTRLTDHHRSGAKKLSEVVDICSETACAGRDRTMVHIDSQQL